MRISTQKYKVLYDALDFVLDLLDKPDAVVIEIRHDWPDWVVVWCE